MTTSAGSSAIKRSVFGVPPLWPAERAERTGQPSPRHDGRVDDQVLDVGIVGHRFEDAPPATLLAPAAEVAGHTIPRTERLGQIAPGQAICTARLHHSGSSKPMISLMLFEDQPLSELMVPRRTTIIRSECVQRRPDIANNANSLAKSNVRMRLASSAKICQKLWVERGWEFRAMARSIHRLNDRTIKSAKERSRLSDGGGLYLQVSEWGTKSWEFRFTLHGRTRTMGLGVYAAVKDHPGLTLAEARDEAATLYRIVRKENKDPIEVRNTVRAKAAIDTATSILFKDAVQKCIARKEGEFRNERHGKNWRRSLDAYALPIIGSMNVAYITLQDILLVLNQPFEDGTLWEKRTETASRLRGRIEAILSWATVAGFRTGDNPARWAGNLKELLPTPSKVAKVTKQPALSQADLPKWFAELRKRGGMAARALEFSTLCASRSGEVRGATWSEIDIEGKRWKIPGARMKMERDHRVPLSDDALALLKALPRIDGSDYVFPAARGGALSDMALSSGVMRKMHAKELKAGRKGWLDPDTGFAAVPHGLRSTFRVWTAERGYDHDMAEMALAHNVGSTVERAYQRSDMVERRRAMMTDWAAFCRGVVPESNVVPIRAAVV